MEVASGKGIQVNNPPAFPPTSLSLALAKNRRHRCGYPESCPPPQIPRASGNPSPQLINEHVPSEAVPLTGFCVIPVPSSVESKLPCIPSLLPLSLPLPPGRYLAPSGEEGR